MKQMLHTIRANEFILQCMCVCVRYIIFLVILLQWRNLKGLLTDL